MMQMMTIQHLSKECFKCKQVKPLCDFYKHSRMKDGHLNKCKDCTKCDVRTHRFENDSVREYDRIRGKTRYSKERTSSYRKRNPEKYKAHCIVKNAIRVGKLVKPSICEDCGAVCKPHGHHDDYGKPLTVRWLCARCHALFHSVYGKF